MAMLLKLSTARASSGPLGWGNKLKGQLLVAKLVGAACPHVRILGHICVRGMFAAHPYGGFDHNFAVRDSDLWLDSNALTKAVTALSVRFAPKGSISLELRELRNREAVWH